MPHGMKAGGLAGSPGHPNALARSGAFARWDPPHPLTSQPLTPHAPHALSLCVCMTRMQLVSLASCLIPVEKSTGK